MLEHCTLAQWQTNSACWHATSSSPTGPFANESQVVGPFSHNCLVRRAADKTFLLFHIGDGGESRQQTPGGSDGSSAVRVETSGVLPREIHQISLVRCITHGVRPV
jgi:hypothetical protein